MSERIPDFPVPMPVFIHHRHEFALSWAVFPRADVLRKLGDFVF